MLSISNTSNCKRQDCLATDDTDKIRMPSKISNKSVGQKNDPFPMQIIRENPCNPWQKIISFTVLVTQKARMRRVFIQTCRQTAGARVAKEATIPVIVFHDFSFYAIYEENIARWQRIFSKIGSIDLTLPFFALHFPIIVGGVLSSVPVPILYSSTRRHLL